MTAAVESMAHVREVPWHGLGCALEVGQPLEVWAKAAGMDWSLRATPVCYPINGDGARDAFATYEDQKVLYRSDSLRALSVVGKRYQVVQPRDVLEFFRDLVELSGFELETAGVLDGGRKFWALAQTGKACAIKGNDLVRGYMLLASSCDGSLATTATPTTVRVVCSNTLNAALGGAIAAVRVSHRTAFDPGLIKSQLGLAVSTWDSFIGQMRQLAERRVSNVEAERFIRRAFSSGDDASTRIAGPAMKHVRAMFDGHGRGAELSSAKGTAWGLLNAVTEYVDHERRARSPERRLDSAWFGPGAALKQRALEQGLMLIA
jgi:phage/plasmid-like protein (TIGR03299 family)